MPIDMLFWMPVMVGGLVAGASCGLLSVYIVGMRIPFIGVCVAHAALAGAVFGSLVGLSGSGLLLMALAASVLTALVLGLADPRRLRMDTNVVMGLLFSVTMGLAFVGMGLFSVLGKSDNEVRSLLWGSLSYCRWSDVQLMLAALAALGVFVILFAKEMRAILFSLDQARSAGIHATAIWAGFLILTAVLMTVNFQTVGGLMIYSLVTNPAAAAFQLVRGHRATAITAMALGGVSGLGGFLLAAATDLPCGPVIVLLSAVLVIVAAIIGRIRR